MSRIRFSLAYAGIPFRAGVLCAAIVCAALLCAARAEGEATLSADGATLTFDVDEADYPEAAPYDYGQNVPAGVTAIVKKGTGAATLGARTNATFTGSISVEGGFLMGVKPAFGKPAAFTVMDGAAAEFVDTADYAMGLGFFDNTQFHVAGAGPDGHGCLQRPNAYHRGDGGFFKSLTLDGDATINIGSRWGIMGGTLDMNNHVLTFSSEKHRTDGKFTSEYSPMFEFRNTVKVRNPGEIVLASGFINVEGGDPRIVDAPDSNGTVSNMVVRMKKNTRLRLFGTYRGSWPCRLVMDENATVQTYYGTYYSGEPYERYSHMDGPVEFSCPTLTFGQYNPNEQSGDLFLHAPVTGVGVARHDVPGVLAFCGATTNVMGGWSQGGASARLPYHRTIEAKYGDLGGVTVVRDDAHLNVTNGAIAVCGGSAGWPARLVVSNNASLVETPTPAKQSARTRFTVGDRVNAAGKWETGWGVLEIHDNAVVSNTTSIGYSGKGACYQFGGFFELFNGPSSGGTEGHVGFTGGSYGYLGIDGGTFRQKMWLYLGYSAPGFIVQRGGMAQHGYNGSGCPLRVAGGRTAASYGLFAVLGGTASFDNYLAMNFNNYVPTGERTTAVVTVDGAGAVLDSSGARIRSVPATNATKAVTALVNVSRGGTLKAQSILVEQVSGGGMPAWDAIREQSAAATRSYLNFNGGVLVTTRAGEFSSTDGKAFDELRLFTRATVYEGGAVIDTDGRDVTWRQPLLKPYGHGVRSVALPAEAMAEHTLLGPTRLFITSGAGGAGASALMDFDNTNRVARGAIVMSPGFGYEASPTCLVHKADCADADCWTGVVETVDYDAAGFAHGGLTKRGAGVLTLATTNTYGGATRLEGGTLAFAHEGGMPGGAVEFAAGAMAALASDSTPLLTADVWRASVLRVAECDELDKNAAAWRKWKKVATFATPVNALPAVEYVDSDGAAATAPGWRFRLAPDGKSLSFGYQRSTVIVLR